MSADSWAERGDRAGLGSEQWRSWKLREVGEFRRAAEHYRAVAAAERVSAAAHLAQTIRQPSPYMRHNLLAIARGDLHRAIQYSTLAAGLDLIIAGAT